VSHDQQGPPLSLAGRRSRWVQPRLVQGRCDQAAAKKFFRKLLTGLTSVPRGIITDQLKSDSAATREVLPSVEHRQHRYLTNGSENSPQPTRQRERWCTSRGGT
jgi:transposase-like protein